MKLLGSNNSNSNKTFPWQTGNFTSMYFCLPFGHRINFYKNSLAAEISFVLSEAESSQDKSKMTYLSPREGKLFKIALFLFGLVLFFSFYFNWNTLNSPHGCREHWSRALSFFKRTKNKFLIDFCPKSILFLASFSYHATCVVRHRQAIFL